MKVGDLVLVGAVVIHHPNLFIAIAGGANEGNLRLRDAGKAAGKFADDFVGELMSEFADLQVRGTTTIDFADDGRGRGVAHVEEPSLNGDLRSRFCQIAEADVVGVGGLFDPGWSF